MRAAFHQPGRSIRRSGGQRGGDRPRERHPLGPFRYYPVSLGVAPVEPGLRDHQPHHDQNEQRHKSPQARVYSTGIFSGLEFIPPCGVNEPFPDFQPEQREGCCRRNTLRLRRPLPWAALLRRPTPLPRSVSAALLLQPGASTSPELHCCLLVPFPSTPPTKNSPTTD